MKKPNSRQIGSVLNIEVGPQDAALVFTTSGLHVYLPHDLDPDYTDHDGMPWHLRVARAAMDAIEERVVDESDSCATRWRSEPFDVAEVDEDLLVAMFALWGNSTGEA